MLAWPRKNVLDRLRTRLEMGQEARRLDVREIVLSVRAGLEDEDAERWVCSCEPARCYARTGPACDGHTVEAVSWCTEMTVVSRTSGEDDIELFPFRSVLVVRLRLRKVRLRLRLPSG